MEPDSKSQGAARCEVCGRQETVWTGGGGWQPFDGCWREAHNDDDANCYRIGYERLLAERANGAPDLSLSASIVDARVSALEGALRSIIIRCTEGDPRSDWLPVIASIARAALSGSPPIAGAREADGK